MFQSILKQNKIPICGSNLTNLASVPWENMAKVHFVGCILLIIYDVGDSMLQQTERAPADLLKPNSLLPMKSMF